PRRFGKSLLVSTLEAYFLGKRELFAGLAMEGLERDWTQHPVLHVDLSQNNFTSDCTLSTELNLILGQWEKIYGRDELECDFSQRFRGVISRAHAQMGQRAVVLVDEYDKPLLDAIDDEALLARNQDVLRGFYGVLKGMDAHLQFVFLTGITRFAHLGIFSGLNNLEDISLDAQYAALCGITEGELRTNLAEGVARLAARRGQTVEEAYGKLKAMYDGYRFSPRATERIYNPFSLLRALKEREYGRYWYETGTPRFLFRLIEQRGVPIAGLARGRMRASQLRGREVNAMGIVPLLYQTGYMTNERYDEAADEYTLRFPNGEVERAFYDDLVQYFFRVDEERGLSIQWLLGRMAAGDAAGLMAGLHAFIAGFSYQIAGEAELYFQNVLVVLFRGLGLETRAELATSDGRIDALVE
ncbi:MAG: AAA family ATPase, partial [Treponemataceae bacterium]